MGSCPSYVVTLFADGRVEYEGRGYVAVYGKMRAQKSPAVAQALLRQFLAAGFNNLKTKYDSYYTDVPGYMLTLRRNGQTKSVRDHSSQRKNLTKLEDAVDLATGSAIWIEGSEGLIENLRYNNVKLSGAEGGRLLVGIVEASNTPQVVDELLRSGADANQVDKFGRTPLMIAARRDQRDFARLLLDNGAAVDPTAGQQSALSYAAATGDLELARMLLAAHADPIHDDGDCLTPLAHAAQSGSPKMTALLLEHGASAASLLPNGEVNRDRCIHSTDHTPVIYKSEKYAQPQEADIDKAAVARLLVTHGSDVNGRNRKGQSAMFDWAPDMLRYLLTVGGNIEQRDPDGETPLTNALDEKTFLFLRDAGADINAANHDGQTLLMQAAFCGCNGALIQAIIDSHADLELRDKQGRTALFLAVENESDAIDLLIAAHANVNAQDARGRTPLAVVTAAFLASKEDYERRDHQAIIDKLRAAGARE